MVCEAVILQLFFINCLYYEAHVMEMLGYSQVSFVIGSLFISFVLIFVFVLILSKIDKLLRRG